MLAVYNPLLASSRTPASPIHPASMPMRVYWRFGNISGSVFGWLSSWAMTSRLTGF